MKKKTEAKRKAILQVAQAAFAENGIERTSMSDLVVRLGGSKSTIYSYFESKNALVAAVMADNASLQLRHAFASLNVQDDLHTNLRRFGRLYLTEMLDPAVVTMLEMVRQYARQHECAQAFYDKGPGTGWSIVESFLAGAVERGELHPRNLALEHVVLQLKGLLLGEGYERVLHGLPAPSADELEACVHRSVATFLLAFMPADQR